MAETFSGAERRAPPLSGFPCCHWRWAWVRRGAASGVCVAGQRGVAAGKLDFCWCGRWRQGQRRRKRVAGAKESTEERTTQTRHLHDQMQKREKEGESERRGKRMELKFFRRD